jgi:hypothetical protein
VSFLILSPPTDEQNAWIDAHLKMQEEYQAAARRAWARMLWLASTHEADCQCSECMEIKAAMWDEE